MFNIILPGTYHYYMYVVIHVHSYIEYKTHLAYNMMLLLRYILLLIQRRHDVF